MKSKKASEETLLEKYAGQALSGFLSNPNIDTTYDIVAELSFDCA